MKISFPDYNIGSFNLAGESREYLTNITQSASESSRIRSTQIYTQTVMTVDLRVVLADLQKKDELIGFWTTVWEQGAKRVDMRIYESENSYDKYEVQPLGGFTIDYLGVNSCAITLPVNIYPDLTKQQKAFVLSLYSQFPNTQEQWYDKFKNFFETLTDKGIF